jgi:hypothetical protein
MKKSYTEAGDFYNEIIDFLMMETRLNKANLYLITK